jgi:hypothetical protein
MQNAKSKILTGPAAACSIGLLLIIVMAAQTWAGTNAGLAGAFLRLGLGARALAMGDVGVALPASGYGIYYNPASLPFLDRMTLLTSYSFLPLDRQLNVVGFAAPLHPLTGRAGEAMNAGVGVGWIGSNSGDIDARDNDGNQIGAFSNTENAFYFSFALRLSELLSVGVSPVIFYNSFPDLTQDEALKSTRVGFDAGVMVHPIPRLYLGAQARHINAQYRWDTSTLYGNDGTTQTDKFPRIYRLGAAYDWDFGLLLAGDFETSDQQDQQLHLGAEYTFAGYEPYAFSLRTGYDDGDLAFGLGLGFAVWKLRGQLDYAYQIQDVPPYDAQVISFSVSY